MEMARTEVMRRVRLAVLLVTACSHRAPPPPIVTRPLGESTAPGPREPVAPNPDAATVTEVTAPLSPRAFGVRPIGNAAPPSSPTPQPPPPEPPPATPPPENVPGEVQPGVASPPPVNP
jgi:hypothetical protein